LDRECSGVVSYRIYLVSGISIIPGAALIALMAQTEHTRACDLKQAGRGSHRAQRL
jgi:hypothetical protein